MCIANRASWPKRWPGQERAGWNDAATPWRRRRSGWLVCDGIADEAAGALSLGMQKRVGLARALACHPRLLLLDEPAGGLNATEKRELTALLRGLRDTLDLTILLIEHDMDLVMTLCDSVTVLDFGRRIAAGAPAAMRDDPAVVAAYLGVPSPDDGPGHAGL